MPPEELRYALLKALQTSPETNQRALSETIGVSVGRINQALRALIQRGLVHVSEAGEGRRQRYDISPLGQAEQSALAAVFIQRKEEQREQLGREIVQLQADLDDYKKGIRPR